MLPTAQTSAINYHVCLKSTESAAIAWNSCDQINNFEHRQTHHNCDQGGKYHWISPAGFHINLHLLHNVYSGAYQQRAGKWVKHVGVSCLRKSDHKYWIVNIGEK